MKFIVSLHTGYPNDDNECSLVGYERVEFVFDLREMRIVDATKVAKDVYFYTWPDCAYVAVRNEQKEIISFVQLKPIQNFISVGDSLCVSITCRMLDPEIVNFTVS